MDSKDIDKDLLPDDKLLASAVRFLIDGKEERAASVLLTCSLSWTIVNTYNDWGEDHYELKIVLRGPRAAYDILTDDANPVSHSVEKAIGAVLAADSHIKHIVVRAEVIEIDPNWRAELLEIARSKGVNNQAVESRSPVIWSNLRFRSASEMRVAQALDRAGVLFFPNCKGRLGRKTRQNKEPDFLVCYEGKWGVLEVDGEPFHPPSRTTEDHERDRLFREHGILVVEHFDATRCYQEPDAVVQQFLDILKKS